MAFAIPNARANQGVAEGTYLILKRSILKREEERNKI